MLKFGCFVQTILTLQLLIFFGYRLSISQDKTAINAIISSQPIPNRSWNIIPFSKFASVQSCVSAILHYRNELVTVFVLCLWLTRQLQSLKSVRFGQNIPNVYQSWCTVHNLDYNLVGIKFHFLKRTQMFTDIRCNGFELSPGKKSSVKLSSRWSICYILNMSIFHAYACKHSFRFCENAMILLSIIISLTKFITMTS